MKTAVYCGTRNVYYDMMTAAKSLLINSTVDLIYFLIEDDEFPYDLPDTIKCINVSNQSYFLPQSPNYTNPWTWMVLMRAALSKVLPGIDRILSLDIDTIVDSNIDELWDIPIDDYYYAAVQEPFRSSGSYYYGNFGVVYFNLKKMREDKKDDEVIRKLNSYNYDANEQDAFNDSCQGKIYHLPPEYNGGNRFTKKHPQPKIYHFAGVKEFQSHEIVQKYQAIFFNEIRKPVPTTNAARKRNARHNNSNVQKSRRSKTDT